MVGKDAQIEQKNEKNGRFHNQKVLVDAENHQSHGSQNVLHDEEVHVPIPKEEIHERVDFLRSPVNVKDREIGIENREQNDQQEKKKQIVTIEVDVQMGFAVCSPPNRPATPEEDVATKWMGRLLAPIA
jgi:hypothetical protein